MTTLTADPSELTCACLAGSVARSRALLRAFTADALLGMTERRAELAIREEGALDIIFPGMGPLQVSLGTSASGFYVETKWNEKPVTTMLCADVRTVFDFLRQTTL